MSESKTFNRDCMEVMREYPDKYFDLAVVDPPYGGGARNRSEDELSADISYNGAITGRFGGRFEKYHLGKETKVKRSGGGRTSRFQTGKKDIRCWDVAPGEEYFKELARVSKNQIIWGGNYFALPPTRCFLIWRKTSIPLEGFSMSPIEYAWTSFNENAAMFAGASQTFTNEPARIHPCQKTVELYAWIFRKFARGGEKILDTHLGSGSSRIAAWEAGLDFVGCEIDETYFALEEERFERHISQIKFEF